LTSTTVNQHGVLIVNMQIYYDVQIIKVNNVKMRMRLP